MKKAYNAHYHLLKNLEQDIYIVVILDRNYERSVKVVKNNTWAGEKSSTIFLPSLPDMRRLVVIDLDCVTRE